MDTEWVAGNVRARGLLARRIGSARTRSLATLATLTEAQQFLVAGPYAHDVRLGQTLAVTEFGVAATLLWNLRVLAGWQPRAGAQIVRLFASGFEMANIAGYARELVGGPTEQAFQLGALDFAWGRVRTTTSLRELRRVLRQSAWGDPGGDHPSDVAVGLAVSWGRRVAAAMPEADGWASGATALVVARHRLLERRRLPDPADAQAAGILGRAALEANDFAEYASALPKQARWALAGSTDIADLWRAEFRWWSGVERDGYMLLRGRRFGPATTIGAVALLAADAWRVRAALQIAARGGGPMEAYDAVA